jgi:hypothetical protein
MESEKERLVKLLKTLHSLATRVPEVILTPVDCTFPVLKSQGVSVMHVFNYGFISKHLGFFMS